MTDKDKQRQLQEIRSNLQVLVATPSFSGLAKLLALGDEEALDAIRSLPDSATVEAREVLRSNARLRERIRSACKPMDVKF